VFSHEAACLTGGGFGRAGRATEKSPMIEARRTAKRGRLIHLGGDGTGGGLSEDARPPALVRIVQMLLGGRYMVGELAEARGIPSHMAFEPCDSCSNAVSWPPKRRDDAPTTRLSNRIWRESWPA